MFFVRKSSFNRDNAFEVFANNTIPLTGLSIRCTTPIKTSPGLLYFDLMYFFTNSLKGSSLVLSP